MRFRFRIEILGALIGFVAACHGQGFGGGGMGGGMGQGPASGLVDVQGGPEDVEDDRPLWTTRTAVLTPGDRVEYKFTVKKGDALFAAVQSESFDPALSVVDLKGKEIAKNDDREEGNQSPLVEVRFPEDGTYLLKVLSYRSAAGGKFSLKFRTFTPVDTNLNKQIVEVPERKANERFRLMMRFPAKKGKIYDLRHVQGVPAETGGSCVFLRAFGPTGVSVNDFRAVAAPGGNPVFEALIDGDFYLSYEADGASRFQTDIREVQIVQIKPVDKVSLNLESNELKVLEMPVEPDQIVHTIVDGPISQSLVTQSDPGTRTGQNDQTYGNRGDYSWFRKSSDSDADVIRIFRKKETARLLVRSWTREAQKLTLTNTDSVPDWKAGMPIQGQMEIGEARYYLLTTQKAELTRLALKASQFLVRADLFTLNGMNYRVLVNSSNTPSTVLFENDAGSFLVRVICEGYGGSGPYMMSRETIAPSPLKLGETVPIELDGKNTTLFAVNLEAGKRYQWVSGQGSLRVSMDLFDQDGKALPSQSVRFGSTDVQYFTAPKTGQYRLWIRGQPGKLRIKFEPFLPPSLGG